jgi:hypothetical protein
MLTLSEKWLPQITSMPETSMGCHVVSVILQNGKRFDQVVIVDEMITQVRGFSSIPFKEKEIDRIVLTHAKWNFNLKEDIAGG